MLLIKLIAEERLIAASSAVLLLVVEKFNFEKGETYRAPAINEMNNEHLPWMWNCRYLDEELRFVSINQNPDLIKLFPPLDKTTNLECELTKDGPETRMVILVMRHPAKFSKVESLTRAKQAKRTSTFKHQINLYLLPWSW